MSGNGNGASQDPRLSEAGRELAHLFDSRHHVICVRTPEERRILRDAVAYAALWSKSVDQSMSVYCWSVARGLMGPDRKAVRGADNSDDPVEVLHHVAREEGSAIYVLLDMPVYFDNRAVVRLLKDLEHDLSQHTKSARYVVLTGANFNLPPELEDTAALLDYGLPTIEELEAVVHEAARQRPSAGLEDSQIFRVAQAGAGLTEDGMRHALLQSLAKTDAIDPQIVGAAKKQAVERSGVLQWIEHLPQPADVGGLQALMGWFRRREVAFFDEARRKKYFLSPPKGVLLVGVPGCGKSLATKVAAALWKLPLVRLDVGRLMGSLLGASEGNLRRALEVAEALAPCVLQVDEIEKAFAGATGPQGDSGVAARMFGHMLTWMEEKKAPVFLCATANRIASLPPEFLRKGRFDDIFFVDLPNEQERLDIWRVHLERRGQTPLLLDMRQLIAKSDKFSGAEIEAAIEAGLYTACHLDTSPSTQMFVDELGSTVPLALAMSEDIRQMQDWAKKHARLATLEA